jgi:hypothetical protein
MLYPYNVHKGQRIQSGVKGDEFPAIYPVHFSTTAGAASATAIHAALALSASAATVTTGITDPDTPRVLKAVGLINANAYATLTTALAGNNNDLVFTAKQYPGNDISVAYVNPNANNATLAVTVTGKAIAVNLATGAGGAITTLASDIATAIAANATANALVGVANAGGNDGTGTVTALAATSLTGGTKKTGGNLVISGTDIEGNAITDTLALNGTTSVNGTKAFATVTSIAVPAGDPNDTVAVGTTNALGIPNKLALDTVVMAFLNGAREATLPTVTVNTASIAQNTVTLNSALNGDVVDVIYYE